MRAVELALYFFNLWMFSILYLTLKCIAKLLITIITTIMLFSCGNQPKNESPMSNVITRGFEANIAKFSEKEQEYIWLFASKLEENGYPLEQITRVELKDAIENPAQFYTYNEVYFFINPSVHFKGDKTPGMQDIGLGWDDPSVVRNPDGSIEFEVGRKFEGKDFIPFFYRVNDSYQYSPLVKNHDEIVNRINLAFLAVKNLETASPDSFSKDKSVNEVISQGLFALLHNYHIEISVDKEKKDVFEVYISRFSWKKVNQDHYYHAIPNNILLEVNCEKPSIKILTQYDPTFFPSPAIPPTDREIFKDDATLFELISDTWDLSEDPDAEKEYGTPNK